MVIINKGYDWDYSVADGSIEDLYQQARMVISTTKGTVPLNRDFGLSPELIDSPTINAIQALKLDIISQFKKYIPSLKLIDATFKDGNIIIQIGVRNG